VRLEKFLDRQYEPVRGHEREDNTARTPRSPRPHGEGIRVGESVFRSCQRKEAEAYHINPFDLTKVWPHRDYPLVEFGELVLDRDPENYFAEVEQAAFDPKNVVPAHRCLPADRRMTEQFLRYYNIRLFAQQYAADDGLAFYIAEHLSKVNDWNLSRCNTSDSTPICGRND